MSVRGALCCIRKFAVVQNTLGRSGGAIGIEDSGSLGVGDGEIRVPQIHLSMCSNGSEFSTNVGTSLEQVDIGREVWRWNPPKFCLFY